MLDYEYLDRIYRMDRNGACCGSDDAPVGEGCATPVVRARADSLNVELFKNENE